MTTHKPYRIGIDLMGSEHSPETFLQALREASIPEEVELHLIATPPFQSLSPYAFHPSDDFVSMEDNPSTAYRKKKNSSMFVGLRLLQTGKLDALISTGNTGALVLGSLLILSTLPQVTRPAFISLFPTKKQPVAVLDLGANVQCKAELLVQFAQIGAAYLRTLGHVYPKIGLLNIGEESIKGTSELRLAYSALQLKGKRSFQFAGNIEGKSAFDGEVDALITDGFTGNIFLKTAEGIANLILDRISCNLSEKTRSLVQPQLSDLQKHLHYAEYPGAILAGLNGLVIKCHGYSTPKALVKAIEGAAFLLSKDFMKSFETHLANDR